MLPIEKYNTKKKKKKELTIKEILEYKEDTKEYDETDRKEIRLYRDIIDFLIYQDNEKSSDNEKSPVYEIDGIKLRQIFKSRALCNWLLVHNVDLIHEFKDSRIAKTYRAHTIDARISKRIEKLIDLGLIELDDEEVDSERGKSKTHQYLLTRNGVIIASLLNLQKFDQESNEYKKNLQFVLNRILDLYPLTYKDSENYYFYFLKKIFQNCFEERQDILFYFFSLMLQYQYNPVINFSLVRSKINVTLYQNMINDIHFKQKFFKSLSDFNTPFWVGVLNDKLVDERRIYQLKTEAQRLIKAQFKLDIELHIDKAISNVLTFNPDTAKSFLLTTKIGRHFSENQIYGAGLYEELTQQHVMNYTVRNEWEKERNKNLLNSDSITTILKCVGCGCIHPYSIEIEKESTDNLFCPGCKKDGSMKHYEFMNEINYILGYPSE